MIQTKTLSVVEPRELESFLLYLVKQSGKEELNKEVQAFLSKKVESAEADIDWVS